MENHISQIKNLKLEKEEKIFKADSPIDLINESFENFVQSRSLNKSTITRENFLEWNFLKDLEERKSIDLLDNNNLEKIPFLTDYLSTNSLKEGKLVKFNCMIQNIFLNEIYVGGFYNKKKEKFLLNIFYEYEEEKANINDNQMMVEGEEDLIQDENNMEGGILLERLVLHCVPLPGLNPTLRKNLKFSDDILNYLNKKKLVVYHYDNHSHKVNEEIIIVGMAYERENEIIIHSWKLKIDYISSFANIIPSLNDVANARNIINNYFKNLFDGDELVSEYLILLLVSQVFSRVGTILIGKLSLNIINTNNPNSINYFAYLQEFIQLITNYTITYSPTISLMNKELLYPRFDPETDELKKGIMQTAKHTFILIDETSLKEGKLDNIGCKNFNTIKNLIDFQCISYEYPYSNVEINHDSQILIFSEKTKTLFSSAQILELYIQKRDGEAENVSYKQCENLLNNINEDEVNLLRTWYNYTKYYEDFIKNFKISQSVSEQIQKDFVEGNKELTGDDLDNCIKLARLYAISNGRSELAFEDYLYVKIMEIQRKHRTINSKK